MKPYKRIFIIGHPGAGKALLSKLLAEKLGWRFIDADLGLEYRVGHLLPAIIGTEGTKHFMSCQHKILRSYLNQENIVVTTDVSVLCNEDNKQLLSTETVVYLKVSTPVQLERTVRNQAPLLLTTDLETFFNDLHKDRDNQFEKAASLTINGDDSNIEKHLSYIMENLLGNGANIQSTVEIKLDRKDMILFHKKSHLAITLPRHQAICLKLLSQGKSSKEIARDMHISYRTVEGYIAKITEDAGCTTSKELISLYHDQP